MSGLAGAFAGAGRPFPDGRPWTQAVVLSYDEETRTVEIDIDGQGTAVSLPAVDGAYDTGDTVVVLRDPGSSGSGQVVLGRRGTPAPQEDPDEPDDPEPEAAPQPTTGKVTVIGSTSITVSTTTRGTLSCGSITSAVVAVGDTVLLLWGEDDLPWVVGKIGTVQPSKPAPIAAPAAPGAPSASRSGATVTVRWSRPSAATKTRWRWSSNSGKSWSAASAWTTSASPSATRSIAQGQTMIFQAQAANSGGSSAWSPSSSAVTYPVPAPKTKQVTTTIKASSSGTYRVSAGQWDRWNTTRWGGSSDVYQGNAYGSGVLVGFAGYGSQLKSLGAISFDKVVLKAKRNGWGDSSLSANLVVQGTSAGSRPSGRPSGSGSTASTGGAAQGATVSVELPAAMREAMRTGSVKGVVATGSEASGWYATGASMALTVTYTRYV